MTRLRSIYDHDPDDGSSSDLGAVRCQDKSLTKQEYRDETDINRIMAQYAETGLAEQANGTARYDDFSQVGDFFLAQNIVAQAKEQFESLPAKVRERFANSPAKLLEFVNDRANLTEARALGLLSAEPVAAVAAPVAVPGEPASGS